MDYFNQLSLILGILILGGSLPFFFFPKQWPDFYIQHVCPETRPPWVALVLFLWSVLFLWTGFKCAQVLTAKSIIVTLFVFLGVFKLALFHFKYAEMRRLAVEALSREKVALYTMISCGLLLGVALLWLSFA